MEAVHLFIPIDRRHALASGKPLAEHASGAVLFADISGFSLLTAALAQHLGAQRGAEELTRHLDGVVGALTAEVNRFHGSVIGFSGDGITCWFDDDNSATDACLRATACALAMQAVIARFPPITTPGTTAIAVGIKVALAAGSVRRLLVGDPAIQNIEVLAGATLNRMADAANYAGRGEIVAAREVIDRLRTTSSTVTFHTSEGEPRLAVIQSLSPPVAECPWGSTFEIGDEMARPWVPAAVYDRIRIGQGEFLAELRPVVAMFLRFTGIDYDGDASAGEKLDSYIRWVQATVERYGGTLLQLSVDDKGSHLYIVIGALQAYADAALRAAGAADRLRTPPADMSFITTSRIGVSRGRLYAGAYGGAARRTYSVLGHEVNVAARLMELAQPGEVLISNQLHDAAAHEYDLADRGETILKGLGEPRHVYAVLGPKPAAIPGAGPASEAQLIGRESESRELARHLHALLAGESSTVILEGAAGIGKSRLVAEFLRESRNQPVTICLGAADAIDRLTPYHAWRGIFVPLFDLGAAPDSNANAASALRIVEQRLASFDPDLVRLAPLLSPVLAVHLPDSPLTKEMTGKVRADNTNDLLVAVLRSAARRAPVVLVLEDAHWMDSASWALLQRVASEVTPLFLIVSTRPSSQAPAEEQAALLRTPAAKVMRLDSLSQQDTGALLGQRLGVATVPEPIVELIFRRSDGHPFFSEIIGRALLEAGLIQVRGNACYLSPGAALESFDAPDTIEGVVTSRIDGLSSAEQLTLKVASVIGRVFTFGILRDVHPVESDAPAVGAHLEHLTQIEMLLEAAEPELSYLFKHVITQEVAYGLLLYRQRRELHRSVARWYEDHAGGDLSSSYARLAHHWSRAARDEQVDAEALEKALDYLEKAGEQALNTHANEEAIRFFSEALELRSLQPKTGKDEEATRTVRTEPRAARWHHRLSLAYQGLGDLGRCREHAQQGLELLGRPIPSGTARLLTGILAQVGRRVFGSMARRRTPIAADSSSRNAALRQVADLYIPLARVAYHTNDALAGLYVNTTKLNLMERLGLSPELAESYGSIGVTLGVFQVHSRADAYIRRAVEVARGTNHSRGLVAAHVISSVYLIGVGQWRRVQEHLEEGRKLCEQVGDHQQWGDCMAIMADAAFLEGDMTRAMGLYDELLAAARRRNNHLQELWAIRGKATAALRDGKADEAVSLLQHAVVLLEDTTDQPTRIDMHGLLAAAHLGCGDWKEADRSARGAAAIIAKTSPPTAYPQYLGYAAVAQTFIELLRRSRQAASNTGLADDLEKQARQAVRNLHTYRRVFAIGRPQAWRYQGLYEELRGNRKKAERSWGKGLASAVALGIPYERDMLQHLIAGASSSDSRPRTEGLSGRP